MAWERRESNLYYYRKKRRGKHVTSEYVGNGPVVQFLAYLDQEERKELNRIRAKWKRQKQEVLDMDSRYAHQYEITVNLIRAVLLISGYHPHKGQWRKRRNVK